ncbi:hypothetical protein GGD63_004734 [Bradyrhizobium sp. cir1]|uniref:hypothetical protein n=1 Tax=Bradyrhizobium sp. cir1 TaxID=1445730 RepID=UPI00160690A5|nr:hypothetical protein [Bradyrhizobium sp. cir1]MBB4371933.1 hypothetical protein [Bradyrhizobium sp. cir1]
MNFQVTVLKILVSYPDGFAPLAELKRDMAILATSGRDWAERTKRMAARVSGLNIFSQKLIERGNGGWRITEKGRSLLEFREARAIAAEVSAETEAVSSEQPKPVIAPLRPAEARRRRHERRQQLRAGNGRRASKS